MSDEKKPFTWDKKKVLALLLLVLILGLVFATRGSRVETTPTIQTDNPKFVLASWDYPDEHGQGIESIYVWHNVSGAWVEFPDSPFYSSDSTEFNATAGENLKVQVYSWLNRSYIGLPEPWNQGHKYIRHSVVVSTSANSSVFSQQNFTYDAFGGTADPVEWYRHTVILDFLPVAGEIYTITIDYEAFFDDGSGTTNILTATDGSTNADTPTGSYTDTHSVNDVFFGGTSSSDMVVILWVTFSEDITSFNYSVYWNSSISSNIYIYNHDISDWSLLDSSPNGEGASLAWDNDTVNNVNYYNETTIGFMFQCGVGEGGGINIDYFQVQLLNEPSWHNINTVALFFSVPFDMTGYNMALVFAGLIMIPVSTMYLAYGVKHDRSSERMFYGLIIFMVGFGLLVSGITP